MGHHRVLLKAGPVEIVLREWTMNTQSSHIPFARLVDLADEGLHGAEGRSVDPHLSTCVECSTIVDRLRGVIELMHADNAMDAPRHAMAAVLNMSVARVDQKVSAIQGIVTTLLFDTMEVPVLQGVRGDAGAERQLLFEAGQKRLHLQVSPAGDEWVVMGQILGSSAGGQVELTGEGGSVEASIDSQCEFALPPVCSGRYSVLVRLEDVELEVPALTLGR